MKKNFPVTGKEVLFGSETEMISTTDLKGVITYINDDFIKVSGFNEEELIGRSHNIIRHPDMPPAAFADLWATLKNGKPWMGIVRNRCKNGDHYWVDAYVTPIHDGDRIVGYQSVRSQPDGAHVRQAEALFRDINRGIPAWRRALGRLAPGSFGKAMLSHTAGLAAGLATMAASGADAGGLIGGVLAGLAVSATGAYFVTLPWKRAAREHRRLFDNPLARQIYTGRSDELGELLLVIQALRAQLRTVLGRIGDYAGHLHGVSEHTLAIVETTHQGVQQQQDQITHVATAMHEMSTTVQEIARNAANTASATRDADGDTQSAIGKVREVIGCIETLASNVHETSAGVRQLAQDSSQIGEVVDVIRSIAEQTNLLALNAAIEAARAGESGRGFAVVAEEVRNLATRTQNSTREIQAVVERLQTEAERAAEGMIANEARARETVAAANSAGDSLSSITDAISHISDMSTQIATASEEQSNVADEINRNVSSINQIAEATALASHSTQDSSEKLGTVVDQMRRMLRQFEAA